MRVFINPGHHPRIDSGAVGYDMHGRMHQEADIAREIGFLVMAHLLDAGADCALLQTDNLVGESPEYECVTDAANKFAADIFVSIHLNAYNGSARGTETLCFSAGGRGEQLANCVHIQLMDAMKARLAYWINRGVKFRPDLAVLKHTEMPAILVEVGFIDNPADLESILAYKHAIAAAIARGCTDYENKVLL